MKRNYAVYTYVSIRLPLLYAVTARTSCFSEHICPGESLWKSFYRFGKQFSRLCVNLFHSQQQQQEQFSRVRALKRRGFLETLRYDTTTTTAVLSSIAHSFSHHCSAMSDLESNLESDHIVKINKSQIF